MTVRAVGGLGSSACRRNDEDDARDTFKFLKSQRIGDKFAVLYTAWARFEAEAGNADKAAHLLAKGTECGAEPAEELAAAVAELGTGSSATTPSGSR